MKKNLLSLLLGLVLVFSMVGCGSSSDTTESIKNEVLPYEEVKEEFFNAMLLCTEYGYEEYKNFLETVDLSGADINEIYDEYINYFIRHSENEDLIKDGRAYWNEKGLELTMSKVSFNEDQIDTLNTIKEYLSAIASTDMTCPKELEKYKDEISIHSLYDGMNLYALRADDTKNKIKGFNPFEFVDGYDNFVRVYVPENYPLREGDVYLENLINIDTASVIDDRGFEYTIPVFISVDEELWEEVCIYAENKETLYQSLWALDSYLSGDESNEWY